MPRIPSALPVHQILIHFVLLTRPKESIPEYEYSDPARLGMKERPRPFTLPARPIAIPRPPYTTRLQPTQGDPNPLRVGHPARCSCTPSRRPEGIANVPSTNTPVGGTSGERRTWLSGSCSSLDRTVTDLWAQGARRAHTGHNKARNASHRTEEQPPGKARQGENIASCGASSAAGSGRGSYHQLKEEKSIALHRGPRPGSASHQALPLPHKLRAINRRLTPLRAPGSRTEPNGHPPRVHSTAQRTRSIAPRNIHDATRLTSRPPLPYPSV